MLNKREREFLLYQQCYGLASGALDSAQDAVGKVVDVKSDGKADDDDEQAKRYEQNVLNSSLALAHQKPLSA